MAPNEGAGPKPPLQSANEKNLGENNNPTTREAKINIESIFPIPLSNNEIITGTKTTNQLNQEISVELKINNKIFKKTFSNETTYIENMETIIRWKDKVSEEKLYNSGFRAEAISFIEANRKNWLSVLTTGIISVASGAGTVLLMSKDGQLGIENDGDGIWSADQASDAVGINARTINAIAPLILTLLTNYANENRFAWEKTKYDKWQTLIAIGDIGAMLATLEETYAFNRGNLAKEDIYRPEELFNKDNFTKVFWNDFSKWFLAEQVLRTLKNGIKISHHTTGCLTSETVARAEALINKVSALIVAGAFANVTYGLNNYDGQNPGHGIEVLPSNSKTKSTIGITLAAAGSYWGSLGTLQTVLTTVKKLVKNYLYKHSSPTEENEVLIKDNMFQEPEEPTAGPSSISPDTLTPDDPSTSRSRLTSATLSSDSDESLDSLVLEDDKQLLVQPQQHPKHTTYVQQSEEYAEPWAP